MAAKRAYTRQNFTATKKLEILRAAEEPDMDTAAIVAKYKLKGPANLYKWRMERKDIEKAAAKEAKQDGAIQTTVFPPKNGLAAPSTNGETKSKLQILGLTPLIKELVADEVRRELGPIVASEIAKAFSQAKR